MRSTKTFLAALGFATLAAAPAFAEVKIYPYHGENYCPAGLQPVTIDGVICCGTPNQTVSYASMKQTPVRRVHTHVKRYTHTHVKTHTHTKVVRHSH